MEGEVSAVDVGVSCPHARGAGQDCTETMRFEKMEKHGPYLEELWQIGVSYQLFMVSCYGRFHLDAKKIIQVASRVWSILDQVEAQFDDRVLEKGCADGT